MTGFSTNSNATGLRTQGHRIAKRMARAGVSSRRESEQMVRAGRVEVNGTRITDPAHRVSTRDRITLDGQAIGVEPPARLWLYHKPVGLVCSHRDEKGRSTLFDSLPAHMPRVVSVGRLDLNSEGLLLLTNNGALKRQLELPANGWVRQYRVRFYGRASDACFAPLRRGMMVEGQPFQPMAVSLEQQSGANGWVHLALREGKNREIRRALKAIGLVANRLIRIAYGPFQLGALASGDLKEVPHRVVRDQLGLAPSHRQGAKEGAKGKLGKGARVSASKKTQGR